MSFFLTEVSCGVAGVSVVLQRVQGGRGRGVLALLDVS